MTNIEYQVWIDGNCQYDTDELHKALSKAKSLVNDKDSFYYGLQAEIKMVMQIERIIKIEKLEKK